MKKTVHRLSALFGLWILLACQAGSAGVFTWNGSVSSDWFAPNNWTPAGVPGSTDTINFTNGTINLTGAVSIRGSFNWSGGALGGDPVSIAAGGVMNITGNVLLEGVLTNAGTVVMSGVGGVTVYNNASSYLGGIYNLAGALWDIQTNASIQCACYGHEFFSNAGVLRKSQGLGQSTIQVAITNAGTVDVENGNFYFAAGGTLSGTYNAATGAVINFGSGAFTMGAPPLLSGPGLHEFTGTTLTLNQDTVSNLVLEGGTVLLGPGFQNGGAITNLTLSGAALGGTNRVTGDFTWSAGGIGAPLTIDTGGVLDITGNVLLEGPLTNAGTVVMTEAGGVTVYNNASSYLGGIYNLAGALWDIQTNASIQCACYGHEFFSNAGVLRKSSGLGQSTLQVAFTNAGTVDAQNGTFYFAGGGALSGAYNAAAGAVINFGSGAFTMGPSPLFSGPGLHEFTGTTLTLAQDTASNLVLAAGTVLLGPGFQNGGAITNLTLSGAALGGTNLVTGDFTWSAGSVASPLTVATGGVLDITGGVLLESPLTNAGTVVMTGTGSVTVYNNATTYLGAIYNLAGALWDIQTNASIQCACYGHEFFDNAGILRKSQGLGQSTIQVAITNSGTVDVENGNFYFAAGGTLSGAYNAAAGAVVNFGSGAFTMGAPPLLSGPGLHEFTGTTLTLAQDTVSNLVLAGGTVLLGPGFQNGGAITNLTLSGAALGGTNLVTGAFTWSAGSVATPLTVATGGVLDITGSVLLESPLTNAGTVVMTGTGSVTVYNNATTYLGAIYNLAGALWDIQTNASIQCACYGHEFFDNAGILRKSQGLGQSTIQVALTNTGTLDAEYGTLYFSPGFTNALGTLTFGVSSASSFGQITVSGNAALNGTVSLAWRGGFLPVVGDTFAVLDYGSHSGTFANLSLPLGAIGAGNYGATAFSVLITSISILPSLSIRLANPDTVIVFWPEAAANFGLQTSTSLSPGNWKDVLAGIATVGTNEVFTNTANGKAAFFRLRSR